jgi:glutathione S-transferase
MFAAFSTVEPLSPNLQSTKLVEKNENWYEQRLPRVEECTHVRLRELDARSGDAHRGSASKAV